MKKRVRTVQYNTNTNIIIVALSGAVEFVPGKSSWGLVRVRSANVPLKLKAFFSKILTKTGSLEFFIQARKQHCLGGMSLTFVSLRILSTAKWRKIFFCEETSPKVFKICQSPRLEWQSGLMKLTSSAFVTVTILI